MITLAIMRHAAARPGGYDHDRPLSDEGRLQAARQGTNLQDVTGGFDVAIVSGATRTCQTLTAMQSAGLRVGRVVTEGSLYTHGWEELVECVRRSGAVSSVLVVGHEPTVSLAVSLMASKQMRWTGFSTVMAVVGDVASLETLGRGSLDVRGVFRV